MGSTGSRAGLLPKPKRLVMWVKTLDTSRPKNKKLVDGAALGSVPWSVQATSETKPNHPLIVIEIRPRHKTFSKSVPVEAKEDPG
ncbi:hypothetical protein EV1_005675 [Malus domestica]